MFYEYLHDIPLVCLTLSPSPGKCKRIWEGEKGETPG